MKKILLTMGCAAMVLSAFATQPKFKINGKINQMKDGQKVYLLEKSANSIDTLAQAVVKGGKFTMEGSVKGMTAANFTFDGRFNRFLFFVDNTDYDINIDLYHVENTNFGPSEEHRLMKKYFAAQRIGQVASSKYRYEMRKLENEPDSPEKAAKVKALRKEAMEAQQLAFMQEMELYKANSNSIVTSYMLAQKLNKLKPEDLKAIYAMLGEKALNNRYGKMIENKVKNAEASSTGQIAPDFTMNTPEGKPLNMHSIKAKVKLIDFWASWCGPCRRENPNVVKIYKEFHDKGLEIIGVSLDNKKEAWVEAIKKDNLTWNHVSDLKGWQNYAAQLYDVHGVPHMVILDENNRIVAKNLRGEKLRAKIAELLK